MGSGCFSERSKKSTVPYGVFEINKNRSAHVFVDGSLERISMSINRREFLMGCSSAIAAMTGGKLSSVAIAQNASPNDPILVTVFLRGGWDALNAIPPIDGDDRGFYEAARPGLKVPARGKDGALRLNDQLGMHPALAPLHELFQDKRLAVVTASGLTSQTRSHFDAMEFMELGTPGAKIARNGWLARTLSAAPKATNPILTAAMSINSSVATSLLGTDAISIERPEEFSLSGDDGYRKQLSSSLRRLYTGETWLHQAGLRTLKAVRTMQSTGVGEYKPSKGVTYPDGGFADSLRTIARLTKQGVGLRAATVDLGGWDTHQYQGDGSGGYFADLLGQLSRGLAALYADLEGANLARRLCVVVMSEFGRRLQQNASGGTDHGHGSALLVLGGNVNGGKVFGRWPGLAKDELYDRADLAITTDYRQVLAEAIVGTFGSVKLAQVFPDFKPGKALGLMRS
jgi:uncharacterized protein (DUF1501 family)